MVPHYYIDNTFCKARSIDSELDWLIIYRLGKLVNDNKDEVIYFALPVCEYWSAGNKIHK